MVVGLSTAQELGLVAVAGAFILFALLSSFVLPSRYPNYPGRRLGAFVAVSALFFVAMLTAIVLLAREPEEAEGQEATPTTETSTQQVTQTQSTQTESTQTTQTEPQVQGDPDAGKPIFTSAGCNGCHTLAAADATAQVGPNLDQLKPAYDRIVKQVENGGGGMPPFKGQLSDDEIHNVAAFVFVSTHQG